MVSSINVSGLNVLKLLNKIKNSNVIIKNDIVKLFWAIGLILTMAGVYFGVWL